MKHVEEAARIQAEDDNRSGIFCHLRMNSDTIDNPHSVPPSLSAFSTLLVITDCLSSFGHCLLWIAELTI